MILQRNTPLTVALLVGLALTPLAAEAQGRSMRTRDLGPLTVDLGTRVFQSEREWRNAQQNSRWGDANVQLPNVNWNREMVLAVSMGPRPTGGYSVDITNVRREGNKIVARVRETTPRPGQAVTQVVTYPGDAVAIPKSNLPVEFVITTRAFADPAFVDAVGLAKTTFIMRRHGGAAGENTEYVAHLFGNPVPYKEPDFVQSSIDVPMSGRAIRRLEFIMRQTDFLRLNSQYGSRAESPDITGRTIVVIREGQKSGQGWVKAVTAYGNAPQAFETMWQTLGNYIQEAEAED